MSDISARMPEVQEKLARLRTKMLDYQIDVVHLSQLANIAWLTAGAGTAVNLASDTGPASLVITLEKAYVVTDCIEAGRLVQEEALEDLGFSLIVEPWDLRNSLLIVLLRGQHLAQDGPGTGRDISHELQDLRTHLQDSEMERLREAGQLAGAALGEVMYAIEPGMSEIAIAGMLAEQCLKRGGEATVNLIASDERISNYRHPLPTRKQVEHYIMVILCMRYQGLIAAATRLIYFGKLPDELAAKAHTIARIEARMIQETQPGKTLGEMFRLIDRLYTDEGYSTAAREHHQGGSLAYLPREILARADEQTVITSNQAFAWNPSIRGAKSEDTFMLTASGPEIITETENWPLWPVPLGDQTIARPAILER